MLLWEMTEVYLATSFEEFSDIILEKAYSVAFRLIVVKRYGHPRKCHKKWSRKVFVINF